MKLTFVELMNFFYLFFRALRFSSQEFRTHKLCSVSTICIINSQESSKMKRANQKSLQCIDYDIFLKSYKLELANAHSNYFHSAVAKFGSAAPSGGKLIL